MKFLNKLLVMAAVAALAGLAASPLMAATNQGDKEISAALSIDNSSTSVSGGGGTQTSTNTFIQGSLGYFLNKSAQVGGALSVFESKTKDSDTLSQFTQGFFKWHFLLDNKPELVPWVGAYLGLVSVKATVAGTSVTGNGTSFGPAAGIKYFVDENTSLNAEYQIITSSYTISGGGLSATIDQTDNTLLLGLSVYFGSKK